MFFPMAGEHDDEVVRSEFEMQAMGAKLVQWAAEVLREHPEADPVGIIAESGTLEARRCRTKYEQATGIEFGAEGVATVMPKPDLAAILGPAFPTERLEWVFGGEKGKEIRFVVCTKNGFRVAALPITATP
jgi:hypothetical protein